MPEVNTNTKTKTKRSAKRRTRTRIRQTVGERVIEGLEQAIAWTKGKNDRVRVTYVQAPDIDVREVRLGMGLSQVQFATKFWLPACHSAELGARAVAARCAHACPIGSNREIPGGRRGRPAEDRLTSMQIAIRLLHDHHRSLPEGGFPALGIDNRHLAVVLAGR